jgi:hypothetical protein
MGVTEMQPASTAAKSVPSSLEELKYSSPIQ